MGMQLARNSLPFPEIINNKNSYTDSFHIQSHRDSEFYFLNGYFSTIMILLHK